MKTDRLSSKRTNTSGRRISMLSWTGLVDRKTLAFFTLLGLVLASGLSVVSTTHQNRFAFNELQELRDEANNLDVAWGQLLLEQSTFGVEGRIEQKAIEQLNMKIPELANIVMVHDE